VWSKKVYLGGRLHCTRATRLIKGEDITEKRDNLRIIAREYFTDSRPGIDASSSSINLASTTSTLSTTDGERAIIWEAQGGDTLLSTEYDNPAHIY
jgi:hypothetical protein